MAGLDFGRVVAAQQEAEAGTWVTLVDQDGASYEPPVRVHVAGASSRRVRVARNRVGFMFADAQRLAGDDAGKVLDATAEIIADGSLDVAVQSTIDWDGVTNAGEPVPFSPANVRALYEALPHLITQVTGASRSLDAAFRPDDGAAAGASDALGADVAAGGADDDAAAPDHVGATRRPTRRRAVEAA